MTMCAIVSACWRINATSRSVSACASLPSSSRQRAIVIRSGPSSRRSTTSMALPRWVFQVDTCGVGIARSSAPGLKPGAPCPWSADAGHEADIKPRERGLPAATGAHEARPSQCEASTEAWTTSASMCATRRRQVCMTRRRRATRSSPGSAEPRARRRDRRRCCGRCACVVP